MTASFPWYDLPCVQWANDALWQATGLPGKLDRTTPLDAQWRAADLLVSQACGLNLFLSDAPIEPFLVPVFDLDCEPGCYYSYLVGSPGGRAAAVNSMSSRSGLSALLTVCKPESLLLTGSHTASLDAVRTGAADMACIDAVTWHILEHAAPSCVQGVPIVDRTSPAPAPPYVVRRNGLRGTVEPLIISAMNNAATLPARQALRLKGVIPATIDDFAPVFTEYHQVAERIPGLSMCRALT